MTYGYKKQNGKKNTTTPAQALIFLYISNPHLSQSLSRPYNH